MTPRTRNLHAILFPGESIQQNRRLCVAMHRLDVVGEPGDVGGRGVEMAVARGGATAAHGRNARQPAGARGPDDDAGVPWPSRRRGRLRARRAVLCRHRSAGDDAASSMSAALDRRRHQHRVAGVLSTSFLPCALLCPPSDNL